MMEQIKLQKNFLNHSKRYQNSLDESMKGSEFVFNYVYLLYYKSHKIIPNHGGSYIGSPDWIKNRKATINPINEKNNKYFQYAVTVALNHKKIEKDSQRITKIKPFVKEYIFHQKKMMEKIGEKQCNYCS